MKDDLALRTSLLPNAEEYELEALAERIEELSGVHVPKQRWYSVFARLRHELEQSGGVANYQRAIEGDPRLRSRLLDVLCPHETRFFREPAQFEHLEEKVYPLWKSQAKRGLRPRTVRVWSAASSTGEEAYSMAISLREAFDQHWELEVLGTDISAESVATANSAIWPIARAGEIPEDLLKRYMLRGDGANEGTMTASPSLQKIVNFKTLNLTAELLPVAGSFDLIFCRNVLIYFRREVQSQVVRRLSSYLAPGGLLATGHAETVQTQETGMVAVGPTIYKQAVR